MLPVSRVRRVAVGSEVLLIWGVLLVLAFSNTWSINGLEGVVALVVDPAGYVVFAGYYLLAVVLGAIARWTNMFSREAWAETLGVGTRG